MTAKKLKLDAEATATVKLKIDGYYFTPDRFNEFVKQFSKEQREMCASKVDLYKIRQLMNQYTRNEITLSKFKEVIELSVKNAIPPEI